MPRVGGSLGFVSDTFILFQQKYQAVVFSEEEENLTAIPMKSHIFRFSGGSIADTKGRYSLEKQSHTSLHSFINKTHNQL